MKRIASLNKELGKEQSARGFSLSFLESKSKKVAAFVGVVSLSAVLVGCGDGQNLNQFLIAGNEDKAVDHLVDRATYHFDRGELDKANEYVDKAYAINPTNEEVVLAKGYISLSQAGVGIFQLSKKLIDLGDDSEAGTNLLLNSADSTDSASEFLSKLGTLIGDEKELDKIKGEEVVGSGLFNGLNYQPPLPADVSREKDVVVIDKTNEALLTICPLVSLTAKVLDSPTANGDTRHEADQCAQSSRSTKNPVQVHFIWALSHLMEATAFNLVLVPALNTLEAQASKASVEPGQGAGGAAAAIEASIAAFDTLATAIDTILPSGPGAENSMLNGMLNDLDATARGFASIPGIPEDMGKKIGEAIAGFRAKQGHFASTGKSMGANSLKDHLVEKVSGKVANYIKNPPESMTTQQIEKACDALQNISPIELAALQELQKCPSE